MEEDDEGIRAVRQIREKISREFGNDPEKLVEHYILEQERFRERLLQPMTTPPDDAENEAARGT